MGKSNWLDGVFNNQHKKKRDDSIPTFSLVYTNPYIKNKFNDPYINAKRFITKDAITAWATPAILQQELEEALSLDVKQIGYNTLFESVKIDNLLLDSPKPIIGELMNSMSSPMIRKLFPRTVNRTFSLKPTIQLISRENIDKWIEVYDRIDTAYKANNITTVKIPSVVMTKRHTKFQHTPNATVYTYQPYNYTMAKTSRDLNLITREHIIRWVDDVDI